MGYPLFTNNAATGLVSPISSSATTLTVNGGSGTLFPNPTGSNYFMITLISSGSGNMEIVQCTARSGDTFTIVRAQEGTTAQSFAIGDSVQLRITAGSLQAFSNPTVVNSVAAGTGIGVSSSTGNVTISNTGVTNLNAGSGISVSANTGTVTVTSTGVTSVTGTSPIVSSGGTTPAISLSSSGVTPASYTAANVTVDTYGRVTSASNGTAPGVYGQIFTSSGTFTVPSGVTAIKVTIIGGGGGSSSGSGSTGGNGGTSSFGAYVSATGGAGSVYLGGGAGGNGSGGDLNFPGGNGDTSPAYGVAQWMQGTGPWGTYNAGYGSGAPTGGGGAGGSGGGGMAIKYVTSLTPGGTVTVTIGAAGTAGSGGGYAGTKGICIVEW